MKQGGQVSPGKKAAVNFFPLRNMEIWVDYLFRGGFLY